MKYLLDTSICVFYLRGKHNLNKVIKEKTLQNCYISEITVFELRYGAENSDDPAKSHKAVAAFLAGIAVLPILGCDIRYAKEKVRLRKAGTPLHDEFDLLIGLSAMENDLVLVTDNVKDFSRLEGIRIENWVSER